MGTEGDKDVTMRPSEYLRQLLKDKNVLDQIGTYFKFDQINRLLEEEISRVRNNLFNISSEQEGLYLPAPIGPSVTLSEKVWVPVEEHPKYNFVGRILGPSGNTAKDLEKFTGTKIMVRGKGSVRKEPHIPPGDKKAERQWEHLKEPLHVLIQVEDSQNRADARMACAIKHIKKLLVPAPEGEDEIKNCQLMELQMRKNMSTMQASQNAQTSRLTGQPVALAPNHNITMLRGPPSPALNTYFLPGRGIAGVPPLPQAAVSSPSFINSAMPPLVSPTEPSFAIPLDYQNYLANAPALLDYTNAIEQSTAAAAAASAAAATNVYNPHLSFEELAFYHHHQLQQNHRQQQQPSPSTSRDSDYGLMESLS